MIKLIKKNKSNEKTKIKKEIFVKKGLTKQEMEHTMATTKPK